MCNSTGSLHTTEKAAGNRRASSTAPLFKQISDQPRFSTRHAHLFNVLVEDCDGRSLNPCHPARARELIRKQRAVCICRRPYTIRLLPASIEVASVDDSVSVLLALSEQDSR